MPILHLLDITATSEESLMSEQGLANEMIQLEHDNDEVDVDEGIKLHYKLDDAPTTSQQNKECLDNSVRLEDGSCNQLQLEQDDDEEDADH